jgi:glycosyltransferase involved in cell wall biosynthesis
MHPMPKLLSAIVITKNEARNIRRCLRSMADWVDEIIVLDSGSTDETVAICHQFTSQVYITDWPGYGPQKNRALHLAQGDWVLSLDADEWVRADLRAEIQQAILQDQFQGFYLPRLNMFCGRFQRYGDAPRDKVLRLFKREASSFTEDFVHEKVICQGKIGYLQRPLLHHSSRTLAEWTAQMEKYALLTARLRHSKGRRSNPGKAVVNSLWIFFRSYILRQGFRDGRLGFIYAKLNAQSSFQKNLHLWRMGK